MEEILTSEYAEEFTAKIYEGKLFSEDLKILHENGYLKDEKLYIALQEYCKERTRANSNFLWSCMMKSPLAVSHAIESLLDDATIYKLRKLSEEEIYG